MSIEIFSRNDTKAQHFISIYPIPIRILPVLQMGLTEAKNSENGTGKLQQIRLTANIAITVRQERLPCRE
jgi:hypothetical protein